MTFAEIRDLPTTVSHVANQSRVHESCLRSWHILVKVKDLLVLSTPADVMLEVIRDLQDAPQSDYEAHEGRFVNIKDTSNRP